MGTRVGCHLRVCARARLALTCGHWALGAGLMGLSNEAFGNERLPRLGTQVSRIWVMGSCVTPWVHRLGRPGWASGSSSSTPIPPSSGSPVGFSSKAGNSLSCWGEECGSDRGPGLWKALGAGRPRGQMCESADFQGRGPQAQAHWTAGGGWGQRVPD